MIISQTPPLHLTYCLNVHPGQSWSDNFAAVRDNALRVRDIVCDADTPFGLGMRLGKLAADELTDDPEKLTEFRQFLDANNLYVFTINGFPYGEFHDPGVKENVYAPDWRTAERRDYTIQLADILADLLPEGVSGSISTVPGSYKSWIKTPEDVEAMVINLADVAAHCYRLRRSRGVSICVALEPEPDCYIETSKEVIKFFTGPMREIGKAYIRKKLNISGHKSAKLLRRHIGVCLDTAHAAVEFEDAAEAALAIHYENIRIAKVQLSSALHVAIPRDAGDELRGRIEAFCDPVYLHQTRIRRHETVYHHHDLPDALEERSLHATDQWRVHFHVPLFFDEFKGLQGTNYMLRGEFADILTRGLTEHLEIETYTFGVLPDDLRPDDLPPAIAKEYQWVLTTMMNAE